MEARKGYFALIQFCPDFSRLEVANVGVLLYCPDDQRVRVKLAGRITRIRKIFGNPPEGPGKDHIHALKRSLKNRLEAERFAALADLRAFIGQRAGELQITEPRFVRYTDPEADLERLFTELVRDESDAEGETKIRVKQRVRERLEEAKLSHLMNDIEVTVPVFRRKIKVPYAFQNGRLNLIQPTPFGGKTEGYNERKACQLAVEGRSLYHTQDSERGAMQLFVVAGFREGDPSREVVRDILVGPEVRFFVEDELDRLVEEIRATARPRA